MFDLRLGDCLEVMAEIPDGSVDLILCDLPYGTTACKWDSVIPFEPLWEQYRRIAKKNAAIVLTASQPFTSKLVMSNPQWFRYDMAWSKAMKTGQLNAKRRPLVSHESVLVFYAKQPTYHPYHDEENPRAGKSATPTATTTYRHVAKQDEYRRPSRLTKSSVLSGFPVGRERGLHPTQKPVALMEYLIRTYTNEGDTVLDNCMGSGSTGVACANTDRRFIGIERDPDYFEIARSRIEQAHQAQVA